MIVLNSIEATKFGKVFTAPNKAYKPVELKNGDYMLPDGAESLVTDRSLTYIKRVVNPSEYKIV